MESPLQRLNTSDIKDQEPDARKALGAWSFCVPKVYTGQNELYRMLSGNLLHRAAELRPLARFTRPIRRQDDKEKSLASVTISINHVHPQNTMRVLTIHRGIRVLDETLKDALELLQEATIVEVQPGVAAVFSEKPVPGLETLSFDLMPEGSDKIIADSLSGLLGGVNLLAQYQDTSKLFNGLVRLTPNYYGKTPDYVSRCS